MKSLFEIHGVNKKAKDVDFIIPFLDIDRRYFIDPSLIRFTSNNQLLGMKDDLTEFIKLINDLLKRGEKGKLEKLLDIGEAGSAGLGYCKNGLDGSGMGQKISQNVAKILRKNPSFSARGFERIEELQWLDSNIGADRISDLCVHILKRELIIFTQNNCKKLGIPTEKVRLHKVFDHDDPNWWVDKIVELPINPEKTIKDAFNPRQPILFIPKEIVRPLPLFLNYNDLYGFIEKEEDSLQRKNRRNKMLVVDKITKDPNLSSRYIAHRETETEKLKRPNFDSGVFEVIDKLEQLPTGNKDSGKFKNLVGELMDILFDDLELIANEKKTLPGDSSRDLVFRNNSVTGVLKDIKEKHLATHITVDAKNTQDVTPKDVKQVASYLNDDLGRFGIIISRDNKNDHQNAAYRILKEDKKVILFITSSELISQARRKFNIQHTNDENVGVDERKLISRKYDDLMIL